MYVFRDGRRSVSSSDLQRSMRQSLSKLIEAGNQHTLSSPLLEGVLRAGELECALADCDHPQQALAARISDQLAARFVSQKTLDLSSACGLLDVLRLRGDLTICVPEGFAYYALHPLQYAHLAQALPLDTKRVAVVGIRSIGTTLSAVVKAALESSGRMAERTTVRPEGHPFDRVTHFSQAQREWIAQQTKHRAQFLVVDEGPGLSGSSFLSTAEALVENGVSREDLILICAHQPDSAKLCARDASSRAPRFTWRAVPGSNERPVGAGAFLGTGRWRERFAGKPASWPGSWTSMERAKFLSTDEKRLYKFEGLGHYGSRVRERLLALGDAGVSPWPVNEEHATGYVAFPLISGQRLDRVPLSQAVLECVADYIALRAELFPADAKNCQANQENLELMLRTNIAEEFGTSADVAALQLVRPVICDARMQPWEWTIANGALIKFDAASHGDDHFFPGPTDVAWDLAGAVVEFSIGVGNESDIARFLLDQYRKNSSDDAGARLPGYLLAYSAFRLGYCKMAAAAMRGSEEEPRLWQQYLQYREFAGRLLARRQAA